MRVSSRFFGALVVPALFLLSGCGDVLDPVGGEVDSVALEPAVSSLEQGEEVQLQAQVKAADGSTLSGRRIFWASEDSAVARVSASGVLLGVSVGTTRVAASVEGKHAITEVSVRVPAVARLTVSPSTVSLAARESGSLSAAATDRRGQPIQGRAVQWVSRSSNVVRVEADGRVHAGRPGTTWVVATLEGQSDSAQVTVAAGAPGRLVIEGGNEQVGSVNAPLPQPLTVRVLDDFGDPLPGVDVQWSAGSGAGQVAPSTSRTDAAGRTAATWTFGSQPGQHTATASVGSLGVTFRSRATAGSVKSIHISADSVELIALRDTARLSATARDEAGNVIPGVSYTWRSQAPSVATVNDQGRVEAIGNGRTVIVASSGGIERSVVVRVNQRVARVVLASKQARINALGHTRSLSAEARDRNGHRVAAAAITWTSLDAAIASVNNAGVVTARARGNARIQAASGNAADTAVVQVQQVVATVRTTPGSESVTVGGAVQLTATAADSAGASIPDAAFQWSSSATSIATVNGQGLVRTHAAGTAQITASSQGRTGSSTVTVRPMVVRPAPVHSVVVEPSQFSLGRNQTRQLVANAYDAEGNLLTGRTVTWRSSAPDRASVNASGLVTAQSPGQATITAEVEGVSGTAAVSVNNSRN